MRGWYLDGEEDEDCGEKDAGESEKEDLTGLLLESMPITVEAALEDEDRQEDHENTMRVDSRNLAYRFSQQTCVLGELPDEHSYHEQHRRVRDALLLVYLSHESSDHQTAEEEQHNHRLSANHWTLIGRVLSRLTDIHCGLDWSACMPATDKLDLILLTLNGYLIKRRRRQILYLEWATQTRRQQKKEEEEVEKEEEEEENEEEEEEEGSSQRRR